MKTKEIIALMALIATVVSTSCSDDSSEDKHRGDAAVTFAFNTVAPTTRGSVITTSNLSSVGILAYDHEGNFSASTTTLFAGFGFSNTQFNVDANQIGTPADAQWWPPSNRSLSFFAYAPYTAPVSSFERTTGYPSFYYTVPTDLASQADLLVSQKTDQFRSVMTDGVEGRTSMTFDHALSAILFTFGDIGDNDPDGVTVTLKNIYSSGTYTYNAGWSGQNTPANFSTTKSNGYNTDYSTISGGDNIMFLMPQTIPNDATIEVSFRSGGNPTSSSTSLKTILDGSGSPITEWQAGKTYRYIIGTSAAISGMTVSYPAGWTDVSTSNNVAGPVTQYESGESFGLFAVDANNKIAISNEQVRAAATGNNVTLTVQPSIFHSSSYTYYLMYPYSTTASGISSLSKGSAAPGSSADEFFANVISGWSVQQNQSTNIKSSDLQVAKIDGSNFTMSHKMGLVMLDMTSGKLVPETRTYTYTGATNSTYTDSPTQTTIYPVHSFKSATGYAVPLNASTSGNCYYIVKATGDAASTQVTFGCGTTQTKEYWSDKAVSGIGYGKCSTTTITSDREYVNYIGLFPYAGQYQQVTLPWTGSYKMECWGGGQAATYVRYYHDKCCGGGYVKGSVSFDRGMVLYVYVGEGGTSSNRYAFNGGGPSSPLRPTLNGGGGTDIRTTKHTSSNGWGGSGDASLRSRIIVAGGGAYTSYDGPTLYAPYTYVKKGGCAGGLVGYDGRDGPYDNYCGKGGTQTAGGASPASYAGHERGGAGQFGYGGAGKESGQNGGGSGGGGGWYGGSGASGAGGGSFGAGGGSSFISGHPYCNGINSAGTHQGAGKPSKVKYQGTGSEHTITFTSTVMIDGGGYAWTSTSRGKAQQMPKPTGGYYDSGFGHPGNGYAKITSE